MPRGYKSSFQISRNDKRTISRRDMKNMVSRKKRLSAGLGRPKTKYRAEERNPGQAKIQKSPDSSETGLPLLAFLKTARGSLQSCGQAEILM